MSKIGVGIGDDFPVDDGNGNRAGGPQGGPGSGSGSGPGASSNSEADDRAEFEEWKRRRDAWRSEREERRAARDDWRRAKRAFKRRIREAVHDGMGDPGNWDVRHDRHGDPRYYHWHPRMWGPTWGLWLLIPLLAILAVFSLIGAIFKAPFVILALIALCAFVCLNHHHRHDHRHDRYGDRRDYYPPPPSSPPPGTPPTVTNGG